MKYLLVKMRRDLTKMWPQFFSVFMMALLAIIIYAGTEGAWYGLKTELDSYFTKSNLASVWVYGNGITQSDINRIKNTEGVADCTSAMTFSAKVKFSNASGSVKHDLALTYFKSTRISRPVTVSGTDYNENGAGIWLDSEFAKANGINVGDSMTLSVGDAEKQLAVKGFVKSPEYIYYTGMSSDLMPDHSLYGFAFIGADTATDIMNETVALKLQEAFLPQMDEKINDAYKTAKEKADQKAEEMYNGKLAEKKNEAYASAEKQADETAKTAFIKAVDDKKQQALNTAYAKADAAAKQAVDQKFRAMSPSGDFTALPQYKKALADAKKQAEEKAEAQVNSEFAKQQPQLDAQLAAVRAQAQRQARLAVDEKFISMQSEQSQQFISAKSAAEKTAEDAATNEILRQYSITKEQLDAVKEMAALPKIIGLDDTKKADASRQLVSMLKALPDSMLSQSVNGFKLSTLKEEPVDYNIIRVKLNSGTNIADFEQKAQDILGDRYAGFADRDSLPSISQPMNKTTQMEKLSVLFSAIFILLSLLTMQTTMTRLVDTQQTQIGTMKALGLTDGQIRRHYAAYGLTVGVLGSVLGLIAGPFIISPVLFRIMARQFTLTDLQIRLSPISFIMVLLVAACCTAATLIACRKGLSGMPAETMRGISPKSGRKLLLERLPRFWQKITFGWKWTMRDISRSKIRTIMGMVGVLGCLMLLVASFGMEYTIGKAEEFIYNSEYTYAYKASIAAAATQENRDSLYAMTKGGQWVQEAAIEYNDSSLRSTGILSVADSGNYVNLKDEKGATVKLTDNSVVITQGTAKKLKLSKGDFIEFRLLGEREYTRAAVADIVNTPSPQGVFLSKAAWEGLGKSFKPTALLTGDINQDKVSGLSYVQDVISRSKQFVGAKNSMQPLKPIFILLKAAAILLGIVILYNLGILSFTERTREYATLKVLGFYQKEIRSFALRENLATTITGWLIGIPVSFWFLTMYVTGVSTASLDLTPKLAATDFILATAVTVGCSVCVSLFLSRKVKKIDMVGALKSVE